MVELAGLRVINLRFEFFTVLLVVVHSADIVIFGNDTATYGIYRSSRVGNMGNSVEVLHKTRILYIVRIPRLVERCPSYD